jgi:hypothetical protein
MHKKMSSQSQKRKKVAMKPIALQQYTPLETIEEDEDLVATLNSWQGPMALSSKALQKASKRGRRRKLKVSTSWPCELI